MFCCNGILFNHESPRRGETFVTRKVTRGLARIYLGLESCLYLGNLDSLRDWGHAKDYVEMQWLMLQQKVPEDFVIATGEQYSVRQFVLWSARELGIDIRFEGKGKNEIGIIDKIKINSETKLKEGDVIIRTDPRYFRPSDVDSLLGDAAKAKKKLRWEPKISTKEMCKEMIQKDLLDARKASLLKEKGL